MQTIGNFDDWVAIEEGFKFPIPGNRVRPVTLEVNSAAAVALHVLQHDGSINFLARVCGRDKVRFVARGETALMIEPLDAAVCYVHTRSGSTVHLTSSEKEKWAVIHERRAWDPQAELLRRIQQQNMEAMDAKLRRMEELARAVNGNNAATADEGDGGDGGQQAQSGARDDAGGGSHETDDRAGK